MKILIVGPAWVGDMVIAQALVQTLLRAEPAAQIHLLAPDATATLGNRMPGIAAVHRLPVRHGELALATRRRTARELEPHAFTGAIVLPNGFKAALVPYFAGIPRRTGWRGEWRYGVLNDLRVLDAARLPRLVDRFVALGLAPDALPPRIEPRLTADRERARGLAAELELCADGDVVALCPGAEYGPAKRWPVHHYATIAAACARRGPVWLLGARGDARACAEIRAAVPTNVRSHVYDVAGRTSLLDAVDLLGLAARVVTNDSGLMHVACALGRRVIALFGSSSPAFTPPLAATASVLREDLPCSPCFARQCRFGHTDCLNRLQPARVLAELAA